jgi:hypothetical protein
VPPTMLSDIGAKNETNEDRVTAAQEAPKAAKRLLRFDRAAQTEGPGEDGQCLEARRPTDRAVFILEIGRRVACGVNGTTTSGPLCLARLQGQAKTWRLCRIPCISRQPRCSRSFCSE